MIKKAVLAAAVAAATVVAATPAIAAPPAPLDEQNWSFQDNLTWADYKKLPGPDYSDPSIQPTVDKWRVALIMVDYPDRPFTISQPAGLDDLRHAFGRRAQRSARRGPAVLRRLLQQAVGAEQLPDHQPVLDGELLRQVRRGARALRPVPAAAGVLAYHIGNFQQITGRLPEPAAAPRPATRTTSTPSVTLARPTSPPPSARRSTTPTTSPPARTRARRGRSSARCGSPAPRP